MSLGQPITVAFSMDAGVGDLGEGTLEIEGMLHYDGETLQFEYRTTQMSLRQSPVRTVAVDPAEVTSIRFKSGLFGSRLILTSTRMGTFEQIPGDHYSDRVVLSVKRGSRAAARNLASLFEINRP